MKVQMWKLSGSVKYVTSYTNVVPPGKKTMVRESRQILKTILCHVDRLIAILPGLDFTNALSFYMLQKFLCRSKFFDSAQKFDCI